MKNTLFSPLSYRTASKAKIIALTNGCGSAKAKFDFVPDTIYGLCITSSCLIHDWMYYEGKTIDDKKVADRVMLNNMLRLIELKGGWLKLFRRSRARKYYLAVKYFGGPAFWEGKNK